MKRNGSVTAYGHTWPLYEQWCDGAMTLTMLPDDKAEMDRLAGLVEFAWI